jgi:uncharacterized protein (DUF2062 family)
MNINLPSIKISFFYFTLINQPVQKFGYLLMQKIVSALRSMAAKEQSATRLTRSFCLGNYIAFSPFIALHTVMAIGISWLLNLNTAITVLVSYGINNPWTAIPIYTVDYLFGRWLLYSLLKINIRAYNPLWIMALEQKFAYYLGIKEFCFWSFMLGGNILGIVTSIILYPVMYPLFRRFIGEQRQKVEVHENYHAK